MPGEEDILKINIDSHELNPALELLQKIDKKIQSISKNSDAFSKLGKGVASANKELKKTDSLFDNINKKLKLTKLMGGVGQTFKSFAGTLGMGALFSVGGLFASAVMGAQGSVASMMAGRRLGIGAGQFQALRYAGKMTGHTEEQLAGVLEKLNEAYRSPEKWGALAVATGGLKAQELRKMDPTEAMFTIFDSIKNSKLAKSPEMVSLLGENLSQIGINLDDFREVLQDGARDMRRAYGEGLGLYSKVDMGKLKKGDEALIRFQTNLDILSKEVGAGLAEPMNQALKALGPLLIKFGEILGNLISKIKAEDVERFGQALEGFMKFFIKFGMWLGGDKTSPETKAKRKLHQEEFYSKEAQEKRKKEVQKAVEKYDKQPGLASMKPITVNGDININVEKAEDADVYNTVNGIRTQLQPVFQ